MAEQQAYFENCCC